MIRCVVECGFLKSLMHQDALFICSLTYVTLNPLNPEDLVHEDEVQTLSIHLSIG